MGMSSGSNGRELSTLAEINVTPLVDVMLVLLIIFMVTATVETVKVEEELKRSREERELVPPKPEPPKNPLKDLPIIVPSTNVKEIQDTEQKEPKVVLDRDLVFRLDDTAVADCKAISPTLAAGARDGNDAGLMIAFEKCAAEAAAKLGPNALLQEKKRVNFACDQGVPYGWAAKFLALMGTEHGLRQVNLIVTSTGTSPDPGAPK